METGKKPDHAAIQMDFQLDLVSQGYRIQKSYKTVERTSAPGDLWCRASENALGLPAQSRERLLLGNQQLLEKRPDEEALASAQQHDTVTDLKRKLLDTGPCTFFEWPDGPGGEFGMKCAPIAPSP
eukprot:1788686-Amphidinium_carterae.3